MSGPLTVHVNRDREEGVDVDREELAVAGPFSLKLTNHGPPAHVHVQLDGGLARVARLDSNTVYLREGDTEFVPVDVPDAAGPVRGELRVATGYGRESTAVPVSVEDEAAGEPRVAVDESLAQPLSGDAESGGTRARWVAPVVVVLVGVAVTAVAALFSTPTIAAMVGVVALLGSLSAAVFLYRQA